MDIQKNKSGDNMDDINIPQENEPGLKRLLDTSYPLLHQFKNRCPGTFKHSQSVASMVEGVALELGLDVTFMKVLATYHDIGKMFNPQCFSENQLDDENLHANVHAKVSFQLISSHVSNTALILLNDGNFPNELIKMACQHHGKSIMRFFYEQHGKRDEEYFRYKSELPCSVQAAILMICDCIEARSRSESMSQGKSFNPKQVIEETINGLMADGQLDDVVIRLGDLQKIKNALATELQGVFQRRIDYNQSNDEESKSDNV